MIFGLYHVNLIMYLSNHITMNRKQTLLDPWTEITPVEPSLLFVTPLAFLPDLLIAFLQVLRLNEAMACAKGGCFREDALT